MRFLFVFLLSGNYLFAQESKFRVLNEVKIGDSLAKQTAELMIFNNTANPICIRVSTTFRAKILSRDTIELGSLKVGDCLRYDLWVSKEDVGLGFNDLPRYPLVLYPRSCFMTTVSVLRNLRCKDSWIEYSYINQPDIDYNELVNKYNNHHVWDNDSKLKYRTRKINL